MHAPRPRAPAAGRRQARPRSPGRGTRACSHRFRIHRTDHHIGVDARADDQLIARCQTRAQLLGGPFVLGLRTRMVARPARHRRPANPRTGPKRSSRSRLIGRLLAKAVVDADKPDFRNARETSVGSAGSSLLVSRITRRVASRSATVRDCCSGATGAQSSSRDLVAGRATQQQPRGCCVEPTRSLGLGGRSRRRLGAPATASAGRAGARRRLRLAAPGRPERHSRRGHALRQGEGELSRPRRCTVGLRAKREPRATARTAVSFVAALAPDAGARANSSAFARRSRRQLKARANVCSSARSTVRSAWARAAWSR
jgi:hypothetical protein